MQSNLSRLAWCCAAALAVASRAHPAAAVTAPYSNDFSTDVAGFNEVTDAQWTLSGATGLYNNTNTTANSASSSLVQVTNLGNNTDTNFSMSTRFTVNSFGDPASTVGFAALSVDNDATDGTGGFYLADYQIGVNNMRLFRIAPNASLKEESSGFTLQTGQPYSLNLAGNYANNGDLTLQLTLTDLTTPSNTHTISTIVVDANVLQGQFYGFRDRTSSNLSVDFDDLSVVPEPAGLALLGAAGLGLLARRRRA